MTGTTGFVAYPSNPASLGQTIQAALSNSLLDRSLELDSWEENDIAGRFIVEPILEGISSADILVADVTRLNFNVVFEIGYAIGRKKRLYLVRNIALTGSDSLINQVGIFDMLGYEKYSSSSELEGRDAFFVLFRADKKLWGTSLDATLKVVASRELKDRKIANE